MIAGGAFCVSLLNGRQTEPRYSESMGKYLCVLGFVVLVTGSDANAQEREVHVPVGPASLERSDRGPRPEGAQGGGGRAEREQQARRAAAKDKKDKAAAAKAKKAKDKKDKAARDKATADNLLAQETNATVGERVQRGTDRHEIGMNGHVLANFVREFFGLP